MLRGGTRPLYVKGHQGTSWEGCGMNRFLSAVTIALLCWAGLTLAGCRVDLDPSDTHVSTGVHPAR